MIKLSNLQAQPLRGAKVTSFVCVQIAELFGEGGKIFVAQWRQWIIQGALAHAQMDAEFGKANSDRFRVEHRDPHCSFQILG